MFYLGKFLQAGGIVLSGYALLAGMSSGDTWTELKLLGVAVALFLIGRGIESKAAGQ